MRLVPLKSRAEYVKDQAYYLGIQSYNLGKAPTECPYTDAKLAALWKRGFRVAQGRESFHVK